MNVRIFKGTAEKVERDIGEFLKDVNEILHVTQSGGGGSHEKMCITLIWR